MNKEPSAKKNEPMKHVEWWFLFAIIVMILVTIFALSNASTTPVRFFMWSFELSLALVIFISAAIGAVIAISLGLMKQLRNRKRFKQLEKQVASLEKEKAALEKDKASLEERLGEMEALRQHATEASTEVPTSPFAEEEDPAADHKDA